MFRPRFYSLLQYLSMFPRQYDPFGYIHFVDVSCRIRHKYRKPLRSLCPRIVKSSL